MRIIFKVVVLVGEFGGAAVGGGLLVEISDYLTAVGGHGRFIVGGITVGDGSGNILVREGNQSISHYQMIEEGAVEEMPIHLTEAGDGKQFLFAEAAFADSYQRQRMAHQLLSVVIILLHAAKHTVEEFRDTGGTKVTVNTGVELFVRAETYQLVQKSAQHEGVAVLGVGQNTLPPSIVEMFADIFEVANGELAALGIGQRLQVEHLEAAALKCAHRFVVTQGGEKILRLVVGRWQPKQQFLVLGR